MTSPEHVALGEKVGIKSGVAIGYPKLDQAFNGEISQTDLKKLRQKMRFDESKPTLLFSSTWDKSGMSAIDIWHERVEELASKYNVMVTVHPFMSAYYKDSLKAKSKVHFIEDNNIIPYLMLADVLVSDTSSIIAEYCAFNKPIVTFKVEKGKRLRDEIKSLIASISVSVSSFEEIDQTVAYSLKHDTLATAREAANEKFFYALDGKASDRAAIEIMKVINQAKLGTRASLQHG
jgi:CDP-glycerol glycerophosphotransferase (TagB/SpsB family)